MSPEAIPRRWRDPALLATALPVVALQLLFFAAPLLLTLLLTFQRSRDYQLTWTWSLHTWIEVFSRPHYWTVLGHTLVMAALCTALCILISLPVAYALANRLEHLAGHVKVLITFAFLTDMTLKTFGWALLLDRQGAASWLLERVGFPPGAVGFLFTDTATMLGMVYNLSAFSIFTIYLAIANIDRSLVLAAYDAGCGRWRAFWEVTLPLARPGIWAGAVLVFLLAAGVFLEPKVLGGGKSPMMAELIRQTFETRVNWPLGAALTLVLMVAAALCVAALSLVYGRRRGAP
jgi:ABC-type spermidine/putrescine transport system permease subunit I